MTLLNIESKQHVLNSLIGTIIVILKCMYRSVGNVVINVEEPAAIGEVEACEQVLDFDSSDNPPLTPISDCSSASTSNKGFVTNHFYISQHM